MTTTPIERLLAIMARLRDPARGCPWDREQNFATIAPYTIEEAYEVADAIARGSMAELMVRAVAASFAVAVKIATPFIVLTMLIYVAMGVLSRLMPQVQVFLLALPVQILLSLILLMIMGSALFMTWVAFYENSLIVFFEAASP